MVKMDNAAKIKEIITKAKQERSGEIIKIKKLESVLINNQKLRKEINEELIETGDVGVLDKLPKETDEQIRQAIESLNKRYLRELLTDEEKQQIKALENEDVKVTIEKNKMIEKQIIKKLFEIDLLSKEILKNIQTNTETLRIADSRNQYILNSFVGDELEINNCKNNGYCIEKNNYLNIKSEIFQVLKNKNMLGEENEITK